VFLFSHRLQTLEGADIQTLDVKAEKAGSKATEAMTKSGAALSQAGAANDTVKAAVDKSDKAAQTAANAIGLATGARREADSFEKDIVSTKKQAAEAESHLAEALQRVANAEARLADRRLPAAQQRRVAQVLCKFGPRNVEIGMYNSDGEIQQLGKDIEGAFPPTCDGRKPAFIVSTQMVQSSIGFSGIQVIVPSGSTRADEDFAAAVTAVLTSEGLPAVGPLGPQNRGGLMRGGGAVRRVVGIEGTSIEIAIGKKP
jgi:hypothetical protein